MPTAIIIMGLRGSGKTTLEFNLRRLIKLEHGIHSVGQDHVFIGPMFKQDGTLWKTGGAEKVMRQKWVEPPRDRRFYIFTGTTGEANNVKAHKFVQEFCDIREFVLHTPPDEEWRMRLAQRPNQSYVPPRRLLKARYHNGRVLHWEAAWTAICDILGVSATPLTLEQM